MQGSNFILNKIAKLFLKNTILKKNLSSKFKIRLDTTKTRIGEVHNRARQNLRYREVKMPKANSKKNRTG